MYRSKVLRDTKVERAPLSFLSYVLTDKKTGKHTHRDGYGCGFLLFKKPDMYNILNLKRKN